MHDLSHFYATFDTTINLPASDPPHYKSEVIDQCFDRLIEIVCGEKRQSVFYFVITRKPSTIQKILLHLTSNIYSNRLTEFKAKAFHQYAYFCSKIAKELQESYCDSVSTYFVKDISYTLLNLSKGNDSFIAELACKYLYKFFVSILPQRSTQVSSLLSTCVKTLAPLIGNPDEKSVAKDVLVLLLKEQKHCLADAIENLGNLPSCVRSEDDYDLESEVKASIRIILKKSLLHYYWYTAAFIVKMLFQQNFLLQFCLTSLDFYYLLDNRDLVDRFIVLICKLYKNVFF